MAYCVGDGERVPFANITQRFGSFVADDIESPRLRQLFAMWLQARPGPGLLPPPGFADPMALRFMLGDLSLLDVEEGEPPRFRYRIYGSNIAAWRGYDMTGKYVSETPGPELRAFIQGSYTEVARRGVPELTMNSAILDGRLFRYEILALPLARDGSKVGRILSAVNQLAESAAVRPKP